MLTGTTQYEDDVVSVAGQLVSLGRVIPVLSEITSDITTNVSGRLQLLISFSTSCDFLGRLCLSIEQRVIKSSERRNATIQIPISM